MLIAKDIMTRTPLAVFASDTVQSVADVITQRKVSSLPVLSSTKEVLGVLSEVAVLKIFIKAKALGQTRGSIYEHKSLFEPIRSVKETDGILDIVQTALKHPHQRVFVLDSVGRLQGVISPKDILAVLNDDNEASVPMQQELKDLRAQVATMKSTKAELHQTEQRLKEYEKLMESTNFMLYAVDANGKIVIANARLHSALGYSAGQLLGKTLHDLYPPHLWKEADEALENAKSMRAPPTSYASYLTRLGGTIRVEVTSQIVPNERGEFLELSTMARVIDSDQLLRLLQGVLK